MLPAENVVYSPSSDMYYGNMSISSEWCSYGDMSSSVRLTFVKPVYLVCAVGSFYSDSISITYNDSFGEDAYMNMDGIFVTYMNMDGIYVR